MTLYVLDTNIISDIASPVPNSEVLNQVLLHQQDILCLCEPVDFEIRRAYLKSKATTRLRAYETTIKPQFQWIKVVGADWRHAAQLWADAASKGKALSDIDLLIAAVTLRLDGILVSADEDFTALSVRRENWRLPA
jgi:predicted nucleic acid-binding protein